MTLPNTCQESDPFIETNSFVIQRGLLALSTVLLVATLYGCTSQIASIRENAQYWTGRSIDEYIETRKRSSTYADRIGRKESLIKLPTGNMDYIVPIRQNCVIHWEVNEARIIVGHWTEGGSCYW